MKRYTSIYILLVLCFTACEKNIDGYENDPRIYFYERDNAIVASRTTLKAFSFIDFPKTVTEDTIFVKARIMGLPAAVDRQFTAVRDTGGNATENTNYKILPGVVKANQVLGYLPVVVYRTADLKTVTKLINLKITDGGAFKAGVTEDARISVSWSDNLVKPANWDTRPGLNTYFGTYSVVKHQFIADVLGQSQFPLQTTNPFLPGMYSHYKMLDLAAQVKDALLAYNNTHNPKLTDEFGLLVTFP